MTPNNADDYQMAFIHSDVRKVLADVLTFPSCNNDAHLLESSNFQSRRRNVSMRMSEVSSSKSLFLFFSSSFRSCEFA